MFFKDEEELHRFAERVEQWTGRIAMGLLIAVVLYFVWHFTLGPSAGVFF